MRSPLFMVADGMGGAQAGEIASRMTAEAFAQVGPDRRHAPADTLRETIRTANRRILERSRSDPDAAGMGTTVTAALMDDDGARSPSPTSATAAPTCCATAACSGSPTTTRSSASWCARASCPRPTPSTTPSAA